MEVAIVTGFLVLLVLFVLLAFLRPFLFFYRGR